MKFLCLVYLDPAVFHSLSPTAKADLDRDSLAYDEHLQAAGHFIAAEALQSTKTSRTVSVRAGRTTVTDGPFGDTKHPLGGFILIEAPDADVATSIAAGIPLAKLGWIEVRPIYNFSASPA